jgi:hypothetical protein
LALLTARATPIFPSLTPRAICFGFAFKRSHQITVFSGFGRRKAAHFVQLNFRDMSRAIVDETDNMTTRLTPKILFYPAELACNIKLV